ncbi:hypothetical protein [Streptomyces benahoarensis]|uniref:Dockerin domain-containing protein n=1 Tax=Streptomyces benahoarensis TaxID=2595054 RepID=A0A553ZQJ4_9ACTN|nr:hypothetical protein [Streptomyces benahoarensis]TSB31777.1 hypothetical protein FNJ62_04545 [Streptomyces benahoarensis]TSB43693.1 hypothetical protein FNZ23_03115 [Streptomyces benahoarensis]
MSKKKLGWTLGAGATMVLGLGVAASALSGANASSPDTSAATTSHPVKVEVLAPKSGDNAGVEGKGWFVDLKLSFRGKTLAQTGFNGLQLTGPAAHNNIAPFPSTFSTGQDDKIPGLVVLDSTTNSTLPGFSGPGTNLANLFNLSGVTNRTPDKTELWDTWIVGAPIAGQKVDTTLTVAVVGDLNHDGIYNDAPNVVKDLNGDGKTDAKDLALMGVASNIVTVPFHINADPA